MSIKNSIQLEINSKKRRFCLSNSIPLHLHSIKSTNSESLACESNQIGEISNKNQREKNNPQEKSPQKKSNKSTAISQRNIPAKKWKYANWKRIPKASMAPSMTKSEKMAENEEWRSPRLPRRRSKSVFPCDNLAHLHAETLSSSSSSSSSPCISLATP